MSEIRSVSVHLDADVAGYIAKIRLAGAETDKAFSKPRAFVDLGDSFKHAEKSAVSLDTQVKKTGTSVDRLGQQVDKTRVRVDTGAKQIDRFSGRLQLLGDVALGLGPALIPIGGVLAGAGFGLGASVLSAATGFVTAKLAVMGLGDAVKALNKAALDPTVTNLEAARLALDKLPPAARGFAVELSHMAPALQRAQQAAASGLFPGLEAGLRHLTTLFPEFNQILFKTGSVLGNLGREAGKSLAGPQWAGFINFVRREGPIGLEVLGRSLGAVTHGVAELVMAGAPLEHDFNRVLLDGANNFDRWATGLSKTQGFKDFIAYIRTNGPLVGQFLQQTADLFLTIAKAAAPFGGPVLQALTGIATALNAIGSTGAGPAIYGTLIALRLLSRAQAGFGAVSKLSWVEAAQGAEGYRAKVSAVRPALIRGGLAAAGLGLAASGVADKFGLANTATLALTGSLAGPWGAAAGAAVGLVMDFGHGQSDAVASTTDLTGSLNQQTGAITDNTRALVAKGLQDKGILDAAASIGIGLDVVTGAALGNTAAMAEFNDQLDRYARSSKTVQTLSGTEVVPTADLSKVNLLRNAVDSTASSMSDARGKAVQLGSAVHGTAGGFNTATSAAERFRQEVERVNAVLTGRQTLRDYQQALDDLTASIKKNGRSLDIDTQKGRDNQAALDNIAKTAIAVAQNLKGTNRTRFMQQARSDLVDAAQKFGKSRAAAQALADKLLQVDHTHAKPTVDLNTNAAVAELNAVQAAINNIDRVVNVHVNVTRNTNALLADVNTPHKADGGSVPGARHPYGDKVLIAAAPGEEIISNRYGQADRFRADRASGRIPGYADGGTVATHSSSGVGAAADGATSALHHFRGALADSTKQLDLARQARQKIAQNRQTLISSATGGFRSDFLAVGASPWTTGSDPFGILRGDISNARRFTRLDRRLGNRGLSRGILSQVDTLAEAQQLAGLSRSRIRDLNRAFATRQRASRIAGVTAGDEVFGKQLAAANHHLAALRGDVHRLTDQVKHLEHAQAEHAKDTGKAVGQEINGTASRANRKARKP